MKNSRTQWHGISSKNGEVKYVARFASHEDAVKWLNTEEYDFRDREIMGRTTAIRIAGKTAVENAVMV